MTPKDAKKQLMKVTPRLIQAMQSIQPSGTVQASFYTQYDAVAQFHVAAELPMGNMATRAKVEDLEHYRQRIREEVVQELLPTLERMINKSQDVVGYTLEDQADLLKEMVDSVYVIMGLGIILGLPFDTGFSIVHFANMMKVKDSAGKEAGTNKIVKPEGWEPADLVPLLIATVEEAKQAIQQHELLTKQAANTAGKSS